MSAPGINLGLNQVLVTENASTTGVIPINNSIKFGTVAAVNDMSDGLSVGDGVMFDSANAQTLMYGSTVYWLVREQHVSGIESEAP